MDDATQKLVDEAPAWLDRHGDVWVFRNGMGWSFETQPFTREHIEKKWGPLVPLEAAQRPPVSPELREEIAAVLFDADEHHDGIEAAFQNEAHTIGGGHNRAVARAQADAILARFSVPSQPVYDEEAIARWMQEWDQKTLGAYGALRDGSDVASALAAALVAALRGGELTREEEKP